MRLSAILLFLLSLMLARAAETRVLFLGDSITYDGRWAAWVESALRNNAAYADAEILNLGLGSETTSGLSEQGHAGGKFPRPCIHERLGRVLAACKPTLVIACYGMNDGIYQPLDEARMNAYRQGMTKLKEEVEKTGSKIVFVTPAIFQPDTPEKDTLHYDAVLDAQAKWLKGQRAAGWKVVDIRPDLRLFLEAMDVMDPDFVFSPDGVHPAERGHAEMGKMIAKGLWPLLGLKGEPKMASERNFPLLKKHADLLRDAYLTETKHTRPGVPEGKPVPEATAESKRLLEVYQAVNRAKKSMWNGHPMEEFTADGRSALLVMPRNGIQPGSPWIWRTEFFGHEPQADISLLNRGFCVAYIDMQDMYGSPKAMGHMDAFYDFLRTGYDVSPKVVLEGFSRGGLFAFNWAALHPGQVAGLYVDAPVCDFKSWPGGKGVGPGSAGDWEKLLKVYGMTEAEALAYTKNPVDNLEPLAKAGIPIFAVIGDADEGVPVGENIDIVEKRYKLFGGKIEVIRKPGGKHHPHSLPDPTPIVEAVMKMVGR
ncbi:GDSL-type esterase/lipase family protein [Luteolibacter sp. GHJ8]|uniref:GDSL-type esterase/lipase family protein n=1 Tax=Luteolibacter rhizosphaerae TaxID=2989719 RepID=A0ABT3FWW0_9BACT|nr:GDSL-type esterase/lipase family protein [Luteolibacter rhizosphaerae]MCW1912082.1 GDSL-type esterase/lipase family protein [Luteolibacter rhizosphaerae]